MRDAVQNGVIVRIVSVEISTWGGTWCKFLLGCREVGMAVLAEWLE